MKKLIFSILPAFLFAFISCMNMSSGSGENGSVRVVLPGSSRAAYNKDDADKFTVRLYNDDFDKTEEGTRGGYWNLASLSREHTRQRRKLGTQQKIFLKEAEAQKSK